MRSKRFAKAIGVFIVATECAATNLFAQATPTNQQAASDAEWKQRMESRMEALEAENKDLRQHVRQVNDTQQAVMKDAQSRGWLTLEGGEPRLTTPDFFDVNKYSAVGDFPGSVRVAGTNTSFQLGGYVQLDAIVDSDRISSRDNFVVNTIQTGGAKTGAGTTNLSVRQSRLFLKTQTPTENWGNLITYIEMDLFGTDGTEPRLRHAYGQLGDKFQVLAGQTWSAFQDATVFPATLDSQGPPGIVNSRRPQIRVREDFNDQWTVVAAIEDPTSDITVPGGFAGQKSTPFPDLDANVRWNQPWGHLQLAGVVRFLQFDPDVGSRSSQFGYGVNLTGSIKALKLDEKNTDLILFQIAGGNGIARYINDSNGLGLDAVLLSPNGSLDGLPVIAGLLGYQHWWAPKWASTVCYSIVSVDNKSTEPASDYHQGQYVVLNLRYFPIPRVMFGAEVLYGVREDHGRQPP